MFAYCRNEPVFRKDTHGTDDVCNEDYNNDNKPQNDLGPPSGGSSPRAGNAKGVKITPKNGNIKKASLDGTNNSNPTVVKHPEAPRPTQMKATDAVDAWDDFLGPNQTSYNPYKGTNDPDRIFSTDGSKSIRFGNHEMREWRTSKAHFHFETWVYDASSNTVNWYNTIQRLK